MQAEPLVSVIIPTYNRKHYLKQSIDSVLAQTYPNLELFIIDDNSQDQTGKFIKKLYATEKKLVYIFNEKNIGDMRSRFKAIKISNAKYIAFLDSDDYWVDINKLSKQVSFLENNPSYGAVYSDINLIDSNSNYISETPELKYIRNEYKSGFLFFDLLNVNFINTLTLCFKRELVTEMFEEVDNKWYVKDYWLNLNISMSSNIFFMNEKMANYRIHDLQLTPSYINAKSRALIKIDILSKLKKIDPYRLIKGEKFIITKQIVALLRTENLHIKDKIKLLLILIKHYKYLSLR